MTLMDQLKDNPFVFVVIICSIVIPGSVGVTTFFYEHQKSSMEKKHDAEISQLELEYKTQISDLKSTKSDVELLKKVKDIELAIENKKNEILELNEKKKEKIFEVSTCLMKLDKKDADISKLKKELNILQGQLLDREEKIEEFKKRYKNCVKADDIYLQETKRIVKNLSDNVIDDIIIELTDVKSHGKVDFTFEIENNKYHIQDVPPKTLAGRRISNHLYLFEVKDSSRSNPESATIRAMRILVK